MTKLFRVFQKLISCSFLLLEMSTKSRRSLRLSNRRGWVGRGLVGRGSWVVGRGSWVVGRGSWVVGRGSPIYTPHVCIILRCFRCPLTTAVLSAISFWRVH